MWYLTIIIIFIIVFVLKTYIEARDGEYYDTDEDDDKGSKLSYRKKYYLFTEAEKKFYDVLKNIMKDDYLIFAKVRVADLLYQSKNQGSWQSDFNRIKAKHVDFVLCDKFKVSPLLAIELDDSSHNNHSRTKRDNFIDEAFKVAQLPILHIKTAYQYNEQELYEKVLDKIKQPQ